MDLPEASPEEKQTLSPQRLREAFARMLGEPAQSAQHEHAAPLQEQPTPEGVVEALLFVGQADDAPLTAEQIAAPMRDITPDEVPQMVERLEAGYRRDGSALRIDQSEGGYRLRVVADLQRIGDRLGGRVRAARLNQQAVQTLALVAYRQPISESAADEQSGESTGATLRRLTKLGLLASQETDGEVVYSTTDRFLRTVGLASLGQLPRLAEVE